MGLSRRVPLDKHSQLFARLPEPVGEVRDTLLKKRKGELQGSLPVCRATYASAAACPLPFCDSAQSVVVVQAGRPQCTHLLDPQELGMWDVPPSLFLAEGVECARDTWRELPCCLSALQTIPVI